MRGKRTDFSAADCAIARALQVIGDWWSLLIIREAFIGRQRFSEFEKSLGLAKNILSNRLKKLVDEGILRFEMDAGSTTRGRYVLTAKGEPLYKVLIALWQWGEKSCFEPGELHQAMIDRRDGKPLAELDPKASDGRSIGPREFAVSDRV